MSYRPSHQDIRPELTLEEYAAFWRAIEGAAKGATHSHVAQLVAQLKYSAPEYRDGLPSYYEPRLAPYGGIPALRYAIDTIYRGVTMEGDRYLSDSTIVKKGMEQLEAWLEWYSPSIRGRLAKRISDLHIVPSYDDLLEIITSEFRNGQP